jgi:hypothetical protein
MTEGGRGDCMPVPDATYAKAVLLGIVGHAPSRTVTTSRPGCFQEPFNFKDAITGV